jgi:hypothetical protein
MAGRQIQVDHRSIVCIRGQRVMLDAHLAVLYRVPTKVLVQAVHRNKSRFPPDFMFRVTFEEAADLRSQTVTSSSTRAWGGRRTLPYAFTEQGVAMLSSVLRSRRAIDVNIGIMRAFVRLRQLMLSNEELARRMNALEKKYDKQFGVVFDAIRQLMSVPPSSRPSIGFRPKVNGEARSGSRDTQSRTKRRAGLNSVRPFIGSVAGPADLSVNKSHVKTVSR